MDTGSDTGHRQILTVVDDCTFNDVAVVFIYFDIEDFHVLAAIKNVLYGIPMLVTADHAILAWC